MAPASNWLLPLASEGIKDAADVDPCHGEDSGVVDEDDGRGACHCKANGVPDKDAGGGAGGGGGMTSCGGKVAAGEVFWFWHVLLHTYHPSFFWCFLLCT